jgi:hypothetical protein
MLEAETPGYLTFCVRAFQLDQAHGWMDMDTDIGRVASVMQIRPPPSGGPTSRTCLKSMRPQTPPPEKTTTKKKNNNNRRRKAGQKLELALGRLQPAAPGKRKEEGVEMRWECAMMCGSRRWGVKEVVMVRW